MVDPISTSLLVLVFGKMAHDIVFEACKDHLKDKLKNIFVYLEKRGERDKVEQAYQEVMAQAYEVCLEMLLQNIKGCGYNNEELREYKSSLEAFLNDDVVAEELFNAVRELGQNDDLPSPDLLRERWKEIGEKELPSDMIWNAVAIAFRRQATDRVILSDELRERLNAGNLTEIKKLIDRQGGVKAPVRLDAYSKRMQIKYSPVDLANLMPAYADDPGRMVIRNVFVAQDVRENPPPIQIPKDLAGCLRKGETDNVDNDQKLLERHELQQLHTTYVNQSSRSVLDLIANADNRLIVLTGEPGSGKSTLMRYLLTGILDPPGDQKSGEPLSWTLAFKEAFPLLIELRSFYAFRKGKKGKGDSFLDYVAYMGKNESWFIDDHTTDGYLKNGPSLVMFDGLDEIFDTTDREQVMQEIAGFAQRYPQARIVVTSRPIGYIGYREQILRDAGFLHFGIQDLEDKQIETFVRGWFALTFPLDLLHE